MLSHKLNSIIKAQEPVVWLDCETTTLDEVFDSLDDHVMSKGDNLRIDQLKISSQEGYSFSVDKYFIMKAFPDSMLTTMIKSKGDWKDKLDVTLPFDKEAIISLEKYLKNSIWKDDENKKFGTEYVTAVTMLHYLNMPLIADSYLLKYFKLPIDYENNCVQTNKNNKLVIVSDIDGYWFDIEKDIIYKKYPDSLLAIVSRGPWADRDEVKLPFSKELLMSLEHYLQIDSWIVTKKLRSGNDLYEAREILDYLMIPFNEDIDYYEDIKKPYEEADDNYEEDIDDDFYIWEEEKEEEDYFW